MENYLKYKGYYGNVEYSSEDDTLFGAIIGIDDLISYEAESIADLKKAFEDSIDDYLETCKAIGKEPNKYFKGVFNVRTSSSTHRELSIIAEKKRMKLNELVNKAFDHLIKHEEEILK